MEISSKENIITLSHDQNLIAFWDWEISAKKKYLSPVFKQMLGYEDHEIPNDPDAWIELILNEDRPLVISAYQKHVSSKGSYPYEVRARYKHKNGSTVYILSKGKVTEWDYMGNPVRMLGYYTDITFIIKEHSGLQEKYEVFKKVIDFMNVGIWTMDFDTGRNYWSENFYKISGYEQNELPPSYVNLLHVLTHPSDVARFAEAIDRQIRNKELYRINVRLSDKQNHFEWFEACGINDDENGKRITGFFVKQKQSSAEHIKVEGAANGVGQKKEEYTGPKEIIEPKKEPERESTVMPVVNVVNTSGKTGGVAEKPKTAEAAVTTETALEVIDASNSLSEGEWEYNLSDAEFFFSKTVHDMLELPENASTRFQSINTMFTEESQDIFQNSFIAAVYNKEAYDITLVCKTPKGNVKTIREKGSPVVDDNGTVIALKGTMEEMGQKDLTSPETLSYVKLLTEQNQQLWNFAHIASHNLRSHASNLQMTLEVMKNSDNEEEKKFFIETIQKISSSFSDTVANLNKLLSKDISKLKTSIQFVDALAAVTSALARQINDTKAIIESDFSECPAIEYIPAYLESIILNLVSNAIKYRHPHRAPHIILRTYIKDGSKMLTVKDNGIGIDLAKHEDKLFRMHQSFHAHPDSMGLGLIITKNQIESFGGSIDVESEPGAGTTFTIRF